MRQFILLSCAISTGALVGALAAQNDLKLPEPFATPSAKNAPAVVPRPTAAQLKLPAGFAVEEYLSGIERPRYMALGPSKELLIADNRPNGAIWLVRGNDKQGKDKKVLLEKLDRPYGIAFWKDYLYVGEATSIKRYKYDAKTMTPGPGEEVVSLKDFGKGPGTRSVLFDHKGAKMYVSIAMEADAETGEDPRRAAINRYNPDGSGHEIFASGIRNGVGLHMYPGTDTVWTGVEERDALGDDLVPDYFTHVREQGFYGWPYAYIGPHEDPRFKEMRPDLVSKTIAPDLVLPAHVSMLDFAFYTGKQFPKQYRGGQIVPRSRVTRLLSCLSRKESRADRRSTSLQVGWIRRKVTTFGAGLWPYSRCQMGVCSSATTAARKFGALLTTGNRTDCLVFRALLSRSRPRQQFRS